MRIECFLQEVGAAARISLGVYNQESLWDALQAAERRHRKMIEKLRAGGAFKFTLVAEPATKDPAPAQPKPRDTTPDLLEG